MSGVRPWQHKAIVDTPGLDEKISRFDAGPRPDDEPADGECACCGWVGGCQGELDALRDWYRDSGV